MKRIRHSIKRKNIPQTKLVSLTGGFWYDSNGELISWTGNTGNAYIGPSTGDTIYNVSGGTVTSGYYRWGTPISNRWNLLVGSPMVNLTSLTNRNPNDENSLSVTGTTLYNTGTTYNVGYYEWNTPTVSNWNYFNKVTGETYNKFGLLFCRLYPIFK